MGNNLGNKNCRSRGQSSVVMLSFKLAEQHVILGKCYFFRYLFLALPLLFSHPHIFHKVNALSYSSSSWDRFWLIPVLLFAWSQLSMRDFLSPNGLTKRGSWQIMGSSRVCWSLQTFDFGVKSVFILVRPMRVLFSSNVAAKFPVK